MAPLNTLGSAIYSPRTGHIHGSNDDGGAACKWNGKEVRLMILSPAPHPADVEAGEGGGLLYEALKGDGDARWLRTTSNGETLVFVVGVETTGHGTATSSRSPSKHGGSRCSSNGSHSPSSETRRIPEPISRLDMLHTDDIHSLSSPSLPRSHPAPVSPPTPAPTSASTLLTSAAEIKAELSCLRIENRTLHNTNERLEDEVATLTTEVESLRRELETVTAEQEIAADEFREILADVSSKSGRGE